MTLSGQLQGALERQNPVFKNFEFIVILETSKALRGESDPFYIFKMQRRNIR